MRGFVGPKDVFRNPEAIWRFFEPTTGVDANPDLIDITLANKVILSKISKFDSKGPMGSRRCSLRPYSQSQWG